MYEEQSNLPPVTYAPREPRLRRPPFWAISAVIIFVIASWVPLVLIAKAKVTPSPETRIQIMQDMGSQPKYREQQSSEIFADGRADRPRIAGTVARGQLNEDDFYYRGFARTTGSDGKSVVKFFEGFPEQVKVTPALLKRGQQRFNIYCSVCHGLDGYGHGPVNERAVELQESKWVPAKSLHDDIVRARPNGHIFNTITNGIRNMPAYGTQVPTEDRWAIIAYVRALELSQNAPANSVPKDQLDLLK